MTGACLHVGCAHAACAGGGGRNEVLSAGGQCLAPRVGGVDWSSPAGNKGGPGGAVSWRGAEPGMRGRLGWCSVRWFFQNCCSRGCLLFWTSAGWSACGSRRRA